MVGGAHKTLDHAETRCPAGRVQHNFFHSEEFGDLALERDGVGCIADQGRRTGAVHATAFDRFLGGCLDSGMRRQAQIVLRGKIYTAHLVAAVVLCPANRVRSVFGRARKRPEVILTTQILPFEKAFGAPEKVCPTGHAEVSHAAGQCGRRNTGVGIV